MAGETDMDPYFWDTQLDYLKSTRAQLWNDDYFEFLVKNVWNLNHPQRIIDFGCGYGYLGTKLLPLLPVGSTYTGIDMGEKLLKEACKLFENTPFHTEFFNIDLRAYAPKEQYDLAICQAVLRHIPQSKAILKKMVDSVVPSGKVICIEVNRKMENAGLYIHNSAGDSLEKDSSLQTQWDDELKNGGRDYMMGIKVPIYMEESGLKDVGIRVNDFVDFLSPKQDGDAYEPHVREFQRINNLQSSNEMDSENASFIHARCLLISWGTK